MLPQNGFRSGLAPSHAQILYNLIAKLGSYILHIRESSNYCHTLAVVQMTVVGILGSMYGIEGYNCILDTSSDPSVATVDSSGVVTPVVVGTTTIKVTTTLKKRRNNEWLAYTHS